MRPYDDKEAEEYKMVLYRFAERCSFHLSDIQVCFGFSEFGLVWFGGAPDIQVSLEKLEVRGLERSILF